MDRSPIRPRPEVLATPPVMHGAFDFSELERLGVQPEGVLDFSVNSNPYGPSPLVREAIARTPPDRYPDRECLSLRRALAERLSLTPDRIVMGNGTAGLLWLVAFAFVRRGDRALILGPTFGEYGRCAGLMGAQIREIRGRARDGFRVDVRAVEAALASSPIRLAFICNPNNPTGTTLAPDLIAHWADRHPGTLFVVDEAYIRFCPTLDSLAGAGIPNVLVLRSMTKDYALAGLRLGYAVGCADVIGALVRARPPWSVNALAQAAGVAALRDEAYLRDTLARIRAAGPELVAGLRGIGLRVIPSEVHYFLVEVGDGARFRGKLLRRGIQVRDCASFGLPACVRIATRRPEENRRLLQAAREVWNEG